MSARLRYVTDDRPGIVRKRSGRGFAYYAPDGSLVTGADRRRIQALAVPPAWTNVWICPEPNGHLQATGRDAKGRKQYRYHPRWRDERDAAKYDRLVDFAQALPAVRGRVARDLARTGMPKQRVVALVVRLLDTTAARVGNEEYAKENGSYGLSTLRNRHARVNGSRVELSFKGKSGKRHVIQVDDPRVAHLIRKCQHIPGQELFQYGDGVPVDSGDVNEYLRAVAGDDFSAKDFRTWAGTVGAVRALRQAGPAASRTAGARLAVRAIETVAAELGNTVAVCRKSYIHPDVLAAYDEGLLCEECDRLEQSLEAIRGLRREEVLVLELLRRTAARIKRAA